MSTNDDRQVADYLRRLRVAAAPLSADRRDELVDEITAHIAEARALGAAAGSGTSAGVRNILERLGPPEEIALAAGTNQAAGDYPIGAVGYGGAGQVAGPPPGSPGRSPQDVITVALLLAGGLLAGIGWIVGVVMLWSSPRWRLSDKLLGTLVWPGGLLAVVVLFAVVGVGAQGTASCATGSPAVSSAAAPVSQVTAAKGGGGGGGGVGGINAAGEATASGPQISPSGSAERVSVAASCTANGPGRWSWLLLALLAAGAPILVAIRLLRRAGGQRAGPAPFSPAQRTA
jgi:hypothetical protein